jgi:hypothetical protein
LFQFLLFRWYYRLALWISFLVRVARLDLHLVPTHPDRAGGLGFLGVGALAFAPLLCAQGALLAGMIANRIFHEGARLDSFKVEILALAAVVILFILGPLFAFTSHLLRAKRGGLREYGLLANRYVREFDHKWLRGGAAPEEALVGSADIQSLADLANSFDVVRTMRGYPFSRDTVLQLAAATLLPVLPLTLTMIPLEQLIDRLLGVVF